MKEEKQFQTESKQLLDLMINSIYSNKEIFLRELISNASDAIDKYKFLSLQNANDYPSKDYHIDLKVNEKDRTISVTDNGIGMSKEDLEKNLGTIAKSGSKDFISKYKELKENKDLDIIGQFGVGFYSAFMVANKVVVTTKVINGQTYRFTSEGVDTYTIEDVSDDSIKDSGTTITVYLKKDTDDEKYSDYLKEYEIKSLVSKYSDYIRYPIKMDVKETVNEKDETGKETGKTHEEVVNKTLNSMIPLWKKPKKDVTDKDLNEFYKNKFTDYEDPALSLNIKVEGMVSYNALIFIPKHAPYNLYSENYEKGLDLYSKGIFIQSKCKELIPDYLKFAKGLVDSDDFNLNISREMLQKSPVMTKIANNIETKIIDKLKEMKKDNPEQYGEFFKTYGDYLKFGIYSSYGMKKDLLQDLLVFPSLNEEKNISFKDYVDKMDKDQKVIYYASGKTLDEIKMLPQLEKYKQNKTDVLLLANNIDEFVLMTMQNYDKKEFKNIASENKDELSKEDKDKIDTLVADNKRTLDNIKEALTGKVDEVTFSNKLVDSPVCITTKEGLSLNMEHVLDNQPDVDKLGDKPKASKVLEINADHDLFKAIASLTDDNDVKQYGTLLYDEALLLEGYDVEDKKAFVKNLNDLMMKAMKH